MLLKEECYCLGHVARLHSFKGEVLIHLDVDDPEDYKGLESVFIEIDGKLIPFFVERLFLRKKSSAVVKFEDIDSEKRAELLVKCGLYLPQEAMPEADQEKKAKSQIIGYRVEDETHGDVGIIEEIIDNKTNPLLRIDKDGAEILVPNQDSFVTKIDHENKVVHIAAPEGLIEMYLGES